MIEDSNMAEQCKINIAIIHGNHEYKSFTHTAKRQIQFQDIRQLEEELNEDDDVHTEYV
jgi:hypothetical protein